MKLAAAVLAGAVALALAGTSSAAKPTYDKWIVRAQGFSIILPTTWNPVPRTVAAVKQTSANLTKAKKTNLARAFGYYLTAAGKPELSAYVFEAFDGTTISDPL